MRQIFFFFLGLIIHIPSPAQESEFTIVRNSDGIVVYERWINFRGSDPAIRAREVMGKFFIATSIEAAVALLKDESKIRLWQDHVTEFQVWEGKDSTTWKEYSYHDIPWPVSDQDHLLEYRIDSGSTPERLFITFRSIQDDKLAPRRDDVTRMDLYGTWTLEQSAENRIQATYTIVSRPIGIPRLFTDPVIRSNIMTTIREYIRLLEHP